MSSDAFHWGGQDAGAHYGTAAPYTKQFAQIVQDFAALAQSSGERELNFDIGSVWLGLAEVTAGNADWLQELYVLLEQANLAAEIRAVCRWVKPGLAPPPR